jgi:hypothetical protein
MKRPFFALEPIDAEFFGSAPVVLSESFEIDRPASSVWSDLVADHPLSWCKILGNGISWTSPKPYGVGTKRTANALFGISALREHFFVWEEGKRMTFYAEEAGAPMFKRFGEDYILEPRGDDACTFTWTIAYEPTLLGKGPVNKAIMRTIFSDTRKHYGTE